MEALENIVKSEAFFPIMLVLLVVLLVLFCFFIISNKNRNNRRRNRKEEENSAAEEIKLLEENQNGLPTVEVVKVEQATVESLPVVDIPIPKIDDTEVIIPDTPVVNETPEEQVVIPIPEVFAEAPVSPTEVVSIEASTPLDAALDIGEKVDISEPTNTGTPDIGEEVMIENSFAYPESIEVPMEKNQAFESIPSEDTTINENITYNAPQEYTGEKTEVFDFPDFSELTGNKDDEQPTVDIDEEIIKTAKQYIQTIMSK